ncbi:uncharacterized protein LOC133296226 [Gastrolobium bilobum]|uniref:uncharacterized protein LOC133296226 n=1 Tax=Gastrolobium bilobum TaxID=150636 RepID=UPI002AB1EF4F|nr:uncharacterized protein LOC133296226 [Gastrolobium bilobum]
MLGVNHVMMKGKRQSKRKKKDIKVTYISSPVKVKTSASNFRATVQELTGQDSNVAEMFVEANDTDGVVHKGSTHQWTEAYLPESTWLKPDYSELHSRSLMEQLNGDLQFELLSYDML